MTEDTPRSEWPTYAEISDRLSPSIQAWAAAGPPSMPLLPLLLCFAPIPLPELPLYRILVFCSGFSFSALKILSTPAPLSLPPSFFLAGALGTLAASEANHDVIRSFGGVSALCSLKQSPCALERVEAESAIAGDVLLKIGGGGFALNYAIEGGF